jgi:hypothetical protein
MCVFSRRHSPLAAEVVTLVDSRSGLREQTLETNQEARVKYGTIRAMLTTAAMAAALAVGVQQLSAQAAPAQTAPAGGVVGDVAQWKGVVTAVDQTARTVVVRGPQGNLHEFDVPASIPNLNNVKVGDTLTISYVEAIALYVRESSDPPEASSTHAVTVKPTGRPAVAHVTIRETEANVLSINQTTRWMTVQGPHFNLHTFHVDPSVAAFSRVKVGDQIVLRYTEALAVAITKG